MPSSESAMRALSLTLDVTSDLDLPAANDSAAEERNCSLLATCLTADVTSVAGIG